MLIITFNIIISIMKDELKIKIINKFLKNKKINKNINLFEKGYLDSISVIDLIDFLEKKNKKKIPEKKISIKNFSSISAILKTLKNF